MQFLIRKSTILFMLYWAFSYGLYGQSDSSRSDFRKTLQLSLGISFPMAMEWDIKNSYTILAPVTIEYKRHFAAVSPVWIIDKNEDIKPFCGISLTYQIAPFYSSRKVNWYVVYEMMYLMQKSSWDRKMLLDNTNNLYQVHYESRWKSFRHQVGYGISVRLTSRLLLDQSLSTGLSFYHYKTEFEVIDNSSLSTQYHSNPLFINSKPVGFIKFGIRYRIIKSKRL